MFRLYGEIAVLAFKRAARSWLAALSIPIYAAIFLVAARLIGMLPLGIVGMFALGMVAAACFAGYLYLLSEGIAGSKIRFADIRKGMHGIWDVVSVSFALWIIGLGVSVLVGAAGSKGQAITVMAALIMAVFFNVIPELIYSSRNRSFALLKESAEFVLANPFAWLGPNVVFGLILLLAVSGPTSFTQPGLIITKLAGLASPFGLAGAIAEAPLWAAPLLIAYFHYVMVFRGLLYRELASGSSRTRAFRRRMEG
jgi:hypothetical protein